MLYQERRNSTELTYVEREILHTREYFVACASARRQTTYDDVVANAVACLFVNAAYVV